MSDVGEAFIATMGRPDPVAPPGLPFGDLRQSLWETLHREIGAGFFRERFLYLFGDGLQALRTCLAAWSFLVPPAGRKGMIVGRNAYGALLVLENPDEAGPTSRVKILDPITVTYGGDPDIDFIGLIGYWLANQQLRGFLDDDLYTRWRQREGRYLGANEMLGIKVPPGLGGELELDNFQVEGIVRYYRTTGPIYAKGLARSRVKSPAATTAKTKTKTTKAKTTKAKTKRGK